MTLGLFLAGVGDTLRSPGDPALTPWGTTGPEDRPLPLPRSVAGGAGDVAGPEEAPGAHGLSAAVCCACQGAGVGQEGDVPEQERWVCCEVPAQADGQTHALVCRPHALHTVSSNSASCSHHTLPPLPLTLRTSAHTSTWRCSIGSSPVTTPQRCQPPHNPSCPSHHVQPSPQLPSRTPTHIPETRAHPSLHTRTHRPLFPALIIYSDPPTPQSDSQIPCTPAHHICTHTHAHSRPPPHPTHSHLCAHCS